MITAYLKATNFCNVGCSHCYLTEEVRADRSKMSEQTLRDTGRLLAQMSGAQRTKAHLIWHGGEPLALRADYYWKAGEILDQELPGHSESLQTSLIPLKDEHLEWIKKRLGGSVGSSMDFSARQVRGSALSYQELWMKKVELCRQEGIRVIPGVTPALPEMGKAEWIMDWMEQRGFERFNIERYNSFGFQAPLLPSNKEHSQFLVELYQAAMSRMEKKGRAPLVRVLAAAIGGVLFNQPGDRWGGSCQSDFIVVEPDGSLNNCPDKTSKERPYGNARAGFEAFARSPERRRWIRIQAIEHREDHCRSCENNTWCKSGCPITCNSLSKPESGGECSGYRSFLSFVRDSVSIPEGKARALAYLETFAKVTGGNKISEGSE